MSIRGWIVITVMLALVSMAPAQNDRRDRQEPELTINAGGRTGTCDAITFSRDGRYLLAAGDDKVVYQWPMLERGFDRENARIYRWPSWREQRGGIKCLALPIASDDPRIAIGGYGLRTSTVAIIDRISGDVLKLASPVSEKGQNFYAVMSIAFAPSGKRVAFGTADGSVFVWELDQPAPRRLGKHRGGDLPEVTFNRVRMIEFLSENDLLTVAEQGQVMSWRAELGAQEGGFRFSLRPELSKCSGVYRAILHPDRKRVLALGIGSHAVLKPIDGTAGLHIDLPDDNLPYSAAFDAKGETLAMSLRPTRPATAPDAPRYFLEGDDEIVLVDVTGERGVVRPGPAHIGRAEAMAWRKDGRLAIAGGDHHEVSIYDRPEAGQEPKDVLRGLGRCIYGVRLSEDGRYVAYRTQCDAQASHPNARGKGAYTVFDLQRRAIVAMPKDVAFPEPARTREGWSIEPSATQRDQWFVISPNGVRVALPFDRSRDETPRCYAFLPTAPNEPVKVAIGHYYGISIFEVTEQRAVRYYLGTGHADEVFCLAPSADGKWLISGGRDQTLAAWSLAPWEASARLGVAFDESLKVTEVDVGSPGWESGLLADDQIIFLAVGAKPLYDANGIHGPKLGTPAEALAALRNPQPGQELYYAVQRPGQALRVENLTTVRQRPLWRFFPAHQNGRVDDWVLWMWRNSFYQTTTNGDFLVGWHVNHPKLDGTPTFHPAQLFRDYFNKPNVINDLLNKRDMTSALRLAMGNNPQQLRFEKLEPAPARIEAATTKVGIDGLDLTLIVEPRGDNPDLLPQRVELWSEDYRLRVWDTKGDKLRAVYHVDQDKLRTGDNVVTLQAINSLGGRSEYTVKLTNERKSVRKRLYGLAVGINNYSKTGQNADGTRSFGNLKAAKSDAQQLQSAWQKQAGRLYGQAKIDLRTDEQATRQDILDELDRLAKNVDPDDQLVMFLSGHGDYVTVSREGGFSTGVFVFCCPQYKKEEYKTTGISTTEFYQKLADIPCRKLVFLDACHSGQVAINPVRSLTPGGKGPTIMAACDQNEYAFEHPTLGNGLFTYSVLEALGVNFNQADGLIDNEKDGLLDPAELFEYVRERMPKLLVDIGQAEDQQNPICFPREPERFPVAQR